MGKRLTATTVAQGEVGAAMLGLRREMPKAWSRQGCAHGGLRDEARSERYRTKKVAFAIPRQR
jgi:hypothetical protein